MFLCGLTPEQVMKLGYRFYLEYVPEDEQQFLIDLNEAGFSFHQTIPVNERKDWYISYDFHILNSGKKILVNHKLTSLVLTSDGRICLALCVVSASSHTSPCHIEMHRVGSSGANRIHPLVPKHWNYFLPLHIFYLKSSFPHAYSL